MTVLVQCISMQLGQVIRRAQDKPGAGRKSDKIDDGSDLSLHSEGTARQRLPYVPGFQRYLFMREKIVTD